MNEKEDIDLMNKYLKVHFDIAKQTGNSAFDYNVTVTKGVQCTPEQITEEFYNQGFIFMCPDPEKDLYLFQNFENSSYTSI